MQFNLIPIGNSQGIRIPKTLIHQLGLAPKVNVTVRREGLLISPAKRPREGWSDALANVDTSTDTILVSDAIRNEWDDSDWVWE